MPTPKRTPLGAWKARARIPDDVRSEYKRRWGQGYEVKLFIPAGVTEHDAKRRYGDWLAAHHGARAGDTRGTRRYWNELTPQEARKLAEDWREWFIPRHAGQDLNYVDRGYLVTARHVAERVRPQGNAIRMKRWTWQLRQPGFLS